VDVFLKHGVDVSVSIFVCLSETDFMTFIAECLCPIFDALFMKWSTRSTTEAITFCYFLQWRCDVWRLRLCASLIDS